MSTQSNLETIHLKIEAFNKDIEASNKVIEASNKIIETSVKNIENQIGQLYKQVTTRSNGGFMGKTLDIPRDEEVNWEVGNEREVFYEGWVENK